MLPGRRSLTVCAALAFLVPLAGAGTLQQAESHAKQGIALAQARNWASAEHELELATQAAPNIALYHAQLGSVFGLEGKWKESLASLQRAVRLDPAAINYRREAAAVQWQLGLAKDAEKNLNYVLAKAPGDPGATLLSGLVSDALGDYRKAVGLLNSQYDMAVAQPERAMILCHASYATDPPTDASRLIETLHSQANEPEWGNSIARCTGFAATAGSLPDAESLFALIPENAVDRHSAGLQLAALELERGNTNNAAALASRAVADRPTDARAWILKGDVELRMNAYRDALESYTRASKLDSSNADAVLDIAGVHFLAGNTDAAISEYKSGINRFPNDARFYVACAETLLDAPEPGTSQAYAESLLTRAVALDPRSAEAHYQLGQLALQQGRLPTAESELSTSLTAGPDRSKVHFALSVVYRRMGQPEQAAKQFAIYQQLKISEDGGNKAAPASKP